MASKRKTTLVSIIAIIAVLLIFAPEIGSVNASSPHPMISLQSITVEIEGRIEIQINNASYAAEIDNLFIILRAPDGYSQVGEPGLWYPGDGTQFNYSEEIAMTIQDVAPLGTLNANDRIVIICNEGVPIGRWELFIGLVSTGYGCGGWTWITGFSHFWTEDYIAQFSLTEMDANSDPLAYFHFRTRWSILDSIIVLAIIVIGLLTSLILWKRIKVKGP
jgi:hypothetical protein